MKDTEIKVTKFPDEIAWPRFSALPRNGPNKGGWSFESMYNLNATDAKLDELTAILGGAEFCHELGKSRN